MLYEDCFIAGECQVLWIFRELFMKEPVVLKKEWMLKLEMHFCGFGLCIVFPAVNYLSFALKIIQFFKLYIRYKVTINLYQYDSPNAQLSRTCERILSHKSGKMAQISIKSNCAEKKKY